MPSQEARMSFVALDLPLYSLVLWGFDFILSSYIAICKYITFFTLSWVSPLHQENRVERHVCHGGIVAEATNPSGRLASG